MGRFHSNYKVQSLIDDFSDEYQEFGLDDPEVSIKELIDKIYELDNTLHCSLEFIIDAAMCFDYVEIIEKTVKDKLNNAK